MAMCRSTAYRWNVVSASEVWRAALVARGTTEDHSESGRQHSRLS